MRGTTLVTGSTLVLARERSSRLLREKRTSDRVFFPSVIQKNSLSADLIRRTGGTTAF